MRCRIYITVMLCFFILVSCSNSSNNNNNNNNNISITKKTIKIAVIKNSDFQQKYFLKGIMRAYEDVLEEYKDSEFNIICDFYDNNETYEDVNSITNKIVTDNDLTAIICSDSPEISKKQLNITQKNEKILVNSGWMYDSDLSTDDDLFFYMSYSSYDIGRLIKKISTTLPAMNWAVCSSQDKITHAEMSMFKTLDNTNVVDYCNINELDVYFNRVIDRWNSLNVNGVVFLPFSKNDFELYYRLKNEMPNIYVITDSDMDNQTEYNEHKELYKNFYIANNFTVDKSEDEYIKYTTNNGEFEDTWETHGYNTFRMIVDTAVKNGTNNPIRIAEIIRKSGYKGKGEEFKFDENGILIPEKFQYVELGEYNISIIPVQ